MRLDVLEIGISRVFLNSIGILGTIGLIRELIVR
jgi:hypothetical protein